MKNRDPSYWLPITAMCLLSLMFTVGFGHIYNQAEALADASFSEKKHFSIVVDPEIKPTKDKPDANMVMADHYALMGPIESADGVELFTPLKKTEERCWSNVVGDHTSVEYIACAWAKTCPVEWSLWGGTRDNPAPPLTLSIGNDVQKTLYAAMENLNVGGEVLAWDEDGQILCMVSRNPALALNNTLTHSHSPGSILKPVSLLLLELQRIDTSIVVDCTGSYKLPDGNEVKCHATHGTVSGAEEALALSCNVFFAHLIQELDPTLASTHLLDMGFTVNDMPGRDLFADSEDVLAYLTLAPSRVTLSPAWTFESTWSLIGQTSVEVNYLHLLWVLSCIAENSLEMPIPSLDTNSPVVRESLLTTDDTEAARKALQAVSAAWDKAFLHYDQEIYAFCSLAKTGTTQLGASGSIPGKRLAGRLRDGSFFLIAVDNTSDSNIPAELARTLAQALS